MNWKELKGLNELFINGTLSDKIKHPYYDRLISMGYLYQQKNKYFKTEAFDIFFKNTHLVEFNTLNQLLTRHLLTHTNFQITDVQALLRIENDKSLLEKDTTVKEISTLYFNSAKYLKKGSLLYKAVLSILELEVLPVDEHDQQFLYVLHCSSKNPKAIILCENDNLLKKPRLNDIELWHAGGRNTAKLKYINEPSIPFYYHCDWDNRGIEIYQDIKANIFPSIQLLIPSPPIKKLEIKSPWKIKINPELFTEEAYLLLTELIPDHWIEEESIKNSLIKK